MDLKESELLEVNNKLNVYSRVADPTNQKHVVFSFTNFKADYWRTFKALSLMHFLERMTVETESWVDQADIPSEERD